MENTKETTDNESGGSPDTVVPVRVFPKEDGPGCYYVDITGKRTEAGPGEVLLVKVELPHSRARRHAWTESIESSEERNGRAIALFAPEIEERLREFLREVVRREPQMDNGIMSTFELKVGVIGWNNKDNSPLLAGTVSEKHEDEV